MLRMHRRNFTTIFKRPYINYCYIAFLFVVGCYTIGPNFEKSRVTPLTRGHSHNDYQRERPLTDALAFGFVSIEADIHLKNGTLYVAHDEEEIDPSRTLSSMYLEPLRKLVERRGGFLYKKKQPVLLMLDFKTDADSTYYVLSQVLEKYKDMLTLFGPNGEKSGALKIIISGERPTELLRKQKIRYAAIDGRLSDIDREESSLLIPLISDKWTDYFTWKGQGDFPIAEKNKLNRLVASVHRQGKLIRFWDTDAGAIETRHRMWRELLNANVDLINTDYIDDLADFIAKSQPKK